MPNENAAVTWYSLREAADKLGMTYSTAKNLVSQDKFPVPSYKLGKRRVVDVEVMEEFFKKRRREGLEKLATTPLGDGRRKPRA